VVSPQSLLLLIRMKLYIRSSEKLTSAAVR
jgi:hypothetical protein